AYNEPLNCGPHVAYISSTRTQTERANSLFQVGSRVGRSPWVLSWWVRWAAPASPSERSEREACASRPKGGGTSLRAAVAALTAGFAGLATGSSGRSEPALRFLASAPADA